MRYAVHIFHRTRQVRKLFDAPALVLDHEAATAILVAFGNMLHSMRRDVQLNSTTTPAPTSSPTRAEQRSVSCRLSVEEEAASLSATLTSTIRLATLKRLSSSLVGEKEQVLSTSSMHVMSQRHEPAHFASREAYVMGRLGDGEPASFTVPDGLGNGTSALDMVVVLAIDDPNAFGGNDSVSVSPMLSVAFNENGNECKISNLSTPFKFLISHVQLPPNVSATCEWFDRNTGAKSSEGCKVVHLDSNSTRSMCDMASTSCTHTHIHTH
jgi:hypothetical protein